MDETSSQPLQTKQLQFPHKSCFLVHSPALFLLLNSWYPSCSERHKTEHRTWGTVSPITSLLLLATLFPVQARMALPSLASCVHCWLCSASCQPATSGFFFYQSNFQPLFPRPTPGAVMTHEKDLVEWQNAARVDGSTLWKIDAACWLSCVHAYYCVSVCNKRVGKQWNTIISQKSPLTILGLADARKKKGIIMG